jgi:prevent-host-death family protein
MLLSGDQSVKTWPVQDAKARFSELLKASLSEGPQVVTLRGIETAVLVPIQQWRDVSARARPSLKMLLLEPGARADLELKPRGGQRRRTAGPID